MINARKNPIITAIIQTRIAARNPVSCLLLITIQHNIQPIQGIAINKEHINAVTNTEPKSLFFEQTADNPIFKSSVNMTRKTSINIISSKINAAIPNPNIT